MQPLGQTETRILEAARGWLGLGKWQEAKEEIDTLAPAFRSHPEVLRVRWHVLAAAGQWQVAGQVARALCTVAPEIPFGWIYLAYTAHKMNHTQQAMQLLLALAEDFPGEYAVSYDLACYACKLGHLGEAWQWLEKAVALDDSGKIRQMALTDPDLEPLWRTVTASKETVENDAGA